MTKTWLVYLFLCRDGTLYCGITNDMPRRIKAHDEGKGAKYTRGRGPVRLVYSEPAKSKGDALRREREIKSMGRKKKSSLARITPGSPRGNSFFVQELSFREAPDDHAHADGQDGTRDG